jgi:hypothetical protein
MTIAASNYGILDSSSYSIPFAQVLARAVGSAPDAPWFMIGDVDSFKLKIDTQKKDRWTKNQRVQVKALQVITQLEASVTFKAMQQTSFIRAASLLGQAVPFTQDAATAASFAISNPVVGKIYYLPGFDVSNVACATDGVTFDVVDQALGGIRFTAIPGSTSSVTITFDKAAITGTDNRNRIQIGTQTRVRLELMVRQVSDIGPKSVLHILDAQLAPNGDQDYVADDFVGVELQGLAALTSNGIGYWQELPA